MHKECFKKCVEVENLELPNMKVIDGDSHFEGCIKLKTIDLSSLLKVNHASSRIFMKSCLRKSHCLKQH